MLKNDRNLYKMVKIVWKIFILIIIIYTVTSLRTQQTLIYPFRIIRHYLVIIRRRHCLKTELRRNQDVFIRDTNKGGV